MRATVVLLVCCVAVLHLPHNVLSEKPVGSMKIPKIDPRTTQTQPTAAPATAAKKQQQASASQAESGEGVDEPPYGRRGYDLRGDERDAQAPTVRHPAYLPPPQVYEEEQRQQGYRQQREAEEEEQRQRQADNELADYLIQRRYYYEGGRDPPEPVDSQPDSKDPYPKDPYPKDPYPKEDPYPPKEPYPKEQQHQEKDHQQEEHEQHTAGCNNEVHCPTPQQADDVKQAYISHGTFSWRALAKESEERRVQRAKLMRQAGVFEEQESQQGKTRPHHISESVLKQLEKQQKLLRDSAAQQSSTQSPGQAAELQQKQAQEPKQTVQVDSLSASQPSDAKSASVSIAAVDKIDFLLPTSHDQTGYGYNGVRAKYLPSDQAIAVGPHPVDPDSVMVIQGAQGSFEVNMVVVETGATVPSVTANRVHMDDMMERAGIPTDNLYGFNPSAWYDPKEKRYVLMWASGVILNKVPNRDGNGSLPDPPSPDEGSPLFMAVSANENPLGDWHVWALDTMPHIAPGLAFCAGQDPAEYAANTPQGTFTDDAVIITMGVYCGDFEGGDHRRSFLSVVYAFSKTALYTRPPEDGCNIYAATYFPATSWYRSVPPSGQALVESKYKPFNNYVQPARPQDVEDVDKPPMLVMKVTDTMISIATLTGEKLDKMTCTDNAPKIVATLVGKGGDFSNARGQPEGVPVMPQPGSYRTLDAGDVGTVDRTHELRVYWATNHKGRVYITTSEYWGTGNVRMPAVYWAIVEPAPGLCSVSRLEWGVVASEEGLAAAYPVIAARRDGGAALAFAYSGAGTISNGHYPAYPGVAATNVGRSDGYGGPKADRGLIQIVKRGPGVINRQDLNDPQFWGTYSAASVCDDKMWFAVVIPEAVDTGSSVDMKHGSWVSAVDL